MPASHRLAVLLGSIAAVLVMSACGGAGGTPAGTNPPVPPIDSPKAARGAQPCDLLDPAGRNRFGLGPGASGRNELGPQCVWHGASSTKVTLTLFTGGEGLSALSRRSNPAAERVRLQGYPALETFTEGGRYCQYDVGTAPKQLSSPP